MKTILIPLLLAFSIGLLAQEDSIENYGELYLVEEKIALDKSTDHQLNFGSVVNHSAFNVNYINYSAQRYFNNFFNYGIDIVKNFVQERQFFETVSGVIENDGKVVARYPDHGAHIFLGLTPIKGSLNWLNSSNFSFYLQSKLGAGMMYDEDEVTKYNPSFFASLSLRFEINRNWGFQTGVRQQLIYIQKFAEQSTAIEGGLTFMFF
jgi:hypothetical protein